MAVVAIVGVPRPTRLDPNTESGTYKSGRDGTMENRMHSPLDGDFRDPVDEPIYVMLPSQHTLALVSRRSFTTAYTIPSTTPCYHPRYLIKQIE